MKLTFGGSGAVAGLVIRSHDVHVLSMRGKTVAQRVHVPIEGDDPSGLTSAIRRAIEAAALETKRMAVSIQSPDILFRFFTIPTVSKAECDTAVQFEVRRYIPFKIESLLWDYRVAPSSENAKRLEVVFAAIPREVFDRLHEAMTAAGVQPTRIEPKSVSLSRLADSAKSAGAGEFVCLVDIEEQAAHLAIIRNRTPYLTRDISLLPSADAPPAGEWSSALPTPDAGAPSGIPPAHEERAEDPQAKRLLSELSVSMDFFMREYPSTTISKVWLCGDESRIGPWCGWFSEQLRAPVALARPLIDQRVQGELPLTFASSVGLLASTARDSSDGAIDFLRRLTAKGSGAATQRPGAMAPAELQTEVVRVLKGPQAVAGVCLAAGLLLALWVVGSMQVTHQRYALSRLKQMNPDVGWGLTSMAQGDLDAFKKQADARIGLLKRIIDQRTSVAAKLDGLVRMLPEGVWLTGLAFQGKMDTTGTDELNLRINGACYLGEPLRELSTIQQFKEQLKTNPQFFQGFAVTRLDEIRAERGEQPQYSYRTFQLNCEPRRRL